jgi:hypothetical protein
VRDGQRLALGIEDVRQEDLAIRQGGRSIGQREDLDLPSGSRRSYWGGSYATWTSVARDVGSVYPSIGL